MLFLWLKRSKMNRYIRQERLECFGVEGQLKLRGSRVVVVGVGALGSLCAELLVRAGVGELLLVDRDVVSLENIHRQFLFKEGDVGLLKTVVAKRELKLINSGVVINTFDDYLSVDNVDILRGFSLVLDCTDNMFARNVIDGFCGVIGLVWVHGAVSGVRGNVLVVDGSVSFKSFFRSGESFDSCAEIGVLNTVSSFVSVLQVNEALKVLVGAPYCRGLLRFNLWDFSFDVFNVKK